MLCVLVVCGALLVSWRTLLHRICLPNCIAAAFLHHNHHRHRHHHNHHRRRPHSFIMFTSSPTPCEFTKSGHVCVVTTWSGETLFLKLAGEFNQCSREYSISTTEKALTRRSVSVLCGFSFQMYCISYCAGDDDDDGWKSRCQRVMVSRL